MLRPFGDANAQLELRAGCAQMLQATPAVLIWGLVTGLTMARSSMNLAECLGMSLIVYGGSAQLAVLPLIASSASLAVIFMTALIVNLRFLIFSAAIRSSFLHLSTARRGFLGYWIADFTFVMFADRTQRSPPLARAEAFYLGLALTNWLAWQVGSIAGILGAAFIPASWGLELAGSIALVALMVPQCASRPGLGGVVVAAVVGVIAYPLPLRLGVVLGVIAGMSVALLIESQQAKHE
jgi:predicted branched-subunit amino acid permease